MTKDDSRDTKTPDRQDVSTDEPRAADASSTIQTRLEKLDRITRTLLADVHTPEDTVLENTDADTRQTIRKRVLEIRAETSRIGLLAIGPKGAIPYRPGEGPTAMRLPSDSGAGSTTYSGPAPEAYERERERRRTADDDREGGTGEDGDQEGYSDDDGADADRRGDADDQRGGGNDD